MVEGTVVGREGSQAAVPLVGVAVVVKGSLRNHAVTDLQGRYSIRVPSSTDTLQFTYLGYKPLERVVGSRTRLDVEMLSESQQVDAVVVTALGLTRKEKSLGYAVSTVGSEDLNNTVTNNWLNGMAGKVAGLNFDTSSAGPGGSIRVTLRGEGSLAYDKNEALFVVDGVPINSGMTSNTENGSYGSTVSTIDYGNGASDLNPDDIESVSVLKGPAATALYGSRAANGAIIITTKSGLKSGGLRVTFNSNVTLEQAGFWPDFQEEYGSGVYESAQIDGVTTPPEYSYWNVAADKSDTGQKITRYHARSSFGERYDPSKMRYIYSSRNWDTDEYTRKPWVVQDWYKGFFRTGVTYSNSISIEGGNGKGNSARVSFKDMRNDCSVVMTVMSVDPDCLPEIAGMVGTSFALSISDIPWNGPIAGINVGHDADISCIFQCNLSRHTVLLFLSLRGLPTEVGECLVGFGHLVGILTLLHSAAGVVGSIHDLACQALRHGALAASTGVSGQPAQTQGLTTGRTHLHGDLIGGAADTAGLDFQAGHDILHRLGEHFQRLLLGLFLDDIKGTVDNLLGNALFTVQHDAVDELRHQHGVVHRIGQDLSLGNITSSGHYASLLHKNMIS